VRMELGWLMINYAHGSDQSNALFRALDNFDPGHGHPVGTVTKLEKST